MIKIFKSKIFKIGIIIGLFLSIITVILVLHFSSPSGSFKKSCSSDDDCSDGGKCIYDPDYNKKICTSGKYCNILDTDNLLECTPGKSDCDICINQPAYTCVVVDKDNPYKVRKGNKDINLPDSNPGKGWCLPPFKSSNKCNPMTADTVLEQTVDSEGNTIYEWSCLCKYPDLVTKSQGGDCDVVVACGEHIENGGVLYTEDNTRWNKDKNTDPRKGSCKCPTGEKYIGTSTYKECVSDSCAPNGHIGEDRKCVCNPGWISCPDQVSNENISKYCNPSMSICIPDPCYPGGEYNKQTGCTCKHPDYIRVANEDSPTSAKCRKACPSSVCDDRGTCKVTTDPKTNEPTEVCYDCNCPYTNVGDTDKLCSVDSGKEPRKGNSCDKPSDCCSGKCKYQFPFGKFCS